MYFGPPKSPEDQVWQKNTIFIKKKWLTWGSVFGSSSSPPPPLSHAAARESGETLAKLWRGFGAALALSEFSIPSQNKLGEALWSQDGSKVRELEWGGYLGHISLADLVQENLRLHMASSGLNWRSRIISRGSGLVEKCNFHKEEMADMGECFRIQLIAAAAPLPRRRPLPSPNRLPISCYLICAYPHPSRPKMEPKMGEDGIHPVLVCREGIDY